jgi:peptidyl-prolyl cis-trans isomerase A (cyclophilin A)
MLRAVRTSWICLAVGLTGLLACQLGAPRPFPPPVPAVVAANQQTGDPHLGRFPYEEAVAGLPEGPALRALIDTDAGPIHCRLDPSSAPIAVANFVGLARGLRAYQTAEGGPWERGRFYDDLPVHRAESGQFIQTGRRGDREHPGFKLQDEMSSGHVFDRTGLLALANSGAPHSSAAQFFITSATSLTHLNGKHTIFGTCDDEDVVRELERRVLAAGGAPPRIRSVVISRGQ